MANDARFWVSTNGDWSDTTSWSATSGGASGATVPDSDDRVTFDRGAVSVTAGLNQSAVDLNWLKILPGYTGNIGTSSASLQISVSNVTLTTPIFQIAGKGQYNFQFTNVDDINISSGTVNMNGSGNLTTGDYLHIGADAVVNVNDTVGLDTTNVRVAGGALVVTSTAGGGNSFLDIPSGRAVLRDAWDTIVIGRGASVRTTEDFSATSIKQGGELEISASGTIAELEAYTGSTTTSNTGGFGLTFTNLYRYLGSQFLLGSPTEVTITNEFFVGSVA